MSLNLTQIRNATIEKCVATIVAWITRYIGALRGKFTYSRNMLKEKIPGKKPTGKHASSQNDTVVEIASAMRQVLREQNLINEFGRATEILYNNDSISCLVMNVGGYQVAVQRTQPYPSVPLFACPINSPSPVMLPIASPEAPHLVKEATDEASTEEQSGSAEQSSADNTGEQTSTNGISSSIAADEQADILDLIDETKGLTSENEQSKPKPVKESKTRRNPSKREKALDNGIVEYFFSSLTGEKKTREQIASDLKLGAGALSRKYAKTLIKEMERMLHGAPKAKDFARATGDIELNKFYKALYGFIRANLKEAKKNVVVKAFQASEKKEDAATDGEME